MDIRYAMEENAPAQKIVVPAKTANSVSIVPKMMALVGFANKKQGCRKLPRDYKLNDIAI